MREELIKERNLLNFYKKMVSLSQKDLRSSELFLEQAFVTMLMGYEFENERYCQRKAYEILLISNLSFNNCASGLNANIDDIIYPFNIIDSEYYRNIMIENPMLIRELMMLCRLTDDLEKGDSKLFSLILLGAKNSNCISAFDSFSKLKDILRAGWIKRNVERDYLESDATHTMQMMAFASAYFTTFKPEDLDYNKVMEMILIHEIGEVLAGDIPEGELLHDSKHDIEARGVRNTFAGLKSGEYFINLWEEFEKRESNEAKFVYELDKFDPIIKAEYLDEELDRTDLLPDFYGYEERRGTFKDGKLKKVFKCLEEKVNK